MTQNTTNNLESRLFNLAFNSPKKLPHLIKKQFKRSKADRLKTLMPPVLSSLIKNHTPEVIDRVMPELVKTVAEFSGVQSAYNLLSQTEVMLRWRKPRIGIYDHTLHAIGGGQKYGCTLASALQDDFDITLIVNRSVTTQDLKSWYNLDLASCKIQVIPLPFFEKNGGREIDPETVSPRIKNPFHQISRESGKYDIFVNNSMLEKVYPLSPVSVLICHFPERRRSSYFYADKYNYLVYNSQYTAEWIQKKWKIKPTTHIYPPVDLIPSVKTEEKENIILSVARFEKGGSKQQLEMAKVFNNLSLTGPEKFRNWKLVLAGGSVADNPYLEKIKNLLSSWQTKNIELKINIPLNELESLYQKAKIFWHFCGFRQSDPARVEHFGMSIVEAMQNRGVPVVFDGGGQKEIVEQGVSGFRFVTLKELKEKTFAVMSEKKLWNDLSQAAYTRSKLFTKEKFVSRVKVLFRKIMSAHFTLE
jgi:glycosyltransferase involved in cell wall biosynthesis